MSNSEFDAAIRFTSLICGANYNNIHLLSDWKILNIVDVILPTCYIIVMP